MARQEVTFDEVAAAALSLQNDGKQVSLEAVQTLLGSDSPVNVCQHLRAWRAAHAQRPEAPAPALPESVVEGLLNWARQHAEQAAAGDREALAQSTGDAEALLAAGERLEAERDDLLAQVAGAVADRDRALATAAEREETIERLNTELRDARQIAMDALVGKAKDQLAIEGKDNQLAELRAQIERNVAATSALSDARLAAEMELVGAVTARNSLEEEVARLRSQLDAVHAERGALRAELEALRAKG